MRRRTWLLISLAVVAGALAVWVPSRLAERQVAAALRPHVDPAGSLTVRARTTALAYPLGRISRLDVDARGIRLGELTGGHLSASLTGVTMVRAPADGRMSITARAGELTLTIGRDDLERFLRTRGVQNPSVTIDASGVTAAGAVRTGTLDVPVRVTGQFHTSSGRDLRFRVMSLDVAGAELPPAVAGTVFGFVQPAVSLDALPFPLMIDRVTAGAGRVVVVTRIEGSRP